MLETSPVFLPSNDCAWFTITIKKQRKSKEKQRSGKAAAGSEGKAQTSGRGSSGHHEPGDSSHSSAAIAPSSLVTLQPFPLLSCSLPCRLTTAATAASAVAEEKKTPSPPHHRPLLACTHVDPLPTPIRLAERRHPQHQPPRTMYSGALSHQCPRPRASARPARTSGGARRGAGGRRGATAAIGRATVPPCACLASAAAPLPSGATAETHLPPARRFSLVPAALCCFFSAFCAQDAAASRI